MHRYLSASYPFILKLIYLLIIYQYPQLIY